MNSTSKKKSARILIIRFSSIGEILLSSPLISDIRENYPEAILHYLTRKEFAPLLEHHPGIDTVIKYDANTGLSGLKKLKNKLDAYDYILDIHNNLRSRFLFPGQFDAKSKIFRIRKNKIKRFQLVKLKVNRYKNVIPVWQKYLNTAKTLLLKQSAPQMVLYLPESILNDTKLKTISENRVVMAPGAKHFTKRWPAEYYTDLILSLYKNYHLKTLLMGGPDEAELADQIEKSVGSEIVTSVAGKYSLLETAQLIKQSKFMITNDSGLMHMAACFAKPTIAIFGSTVKELGFFPLNKKACVVEKNGLDCRPCSHIGRKSCPKQHFKCMNEILPADILKVIQKKEWI